MKKLSLLGFILIFAAINSFAQSTILKLPTADNTSNFNVTNSSDAAMLKVNADGGFFLGGTYSSGSIPVEGAGARLMWYPKKAAFRAGYTIDDQWNDTKIGNCSVAMGYNTEARGTGSTASGYQCAATNIYTTAMGVNAQANGMYSTAIGYNTIANGNYSSAIGYNTNASGAGSTAMCYYTTASGSSSVSMGSSTTASGSVSTAMGYLTTASGNNSTAIGNYVSTNSFAGSFIISDNSSGTVHNSSSANQMSMRFAGGYRFFTSSAFSDAQCAFLNANANSWSTSSDSTKKENFIKADGEYFLSSLSKLRLGSWNYRNLSVDKSKDIQTGRHYGPMAQEIFHYFGKDELGVIGNDTSLAAADMDGIIMICLQALEKRTVELKNAEKRITELENALSEQNNKIASQQSIIDEMVKRFTAIESKINIPVINHESLSLNSQSE